MCSTKMILVGSALLAAGCVQQPHNNVLLFGTDTKVALDVSSSATSGGAPQITLGYRRAEAVWMPLAVNDRQCADNKPDQCAVQTAFEPNDDGSGKKPDKYTGKTTKTTYSADGKKTVEETERDAYSVFASFGAKFAGEATSTNARASGGLAQFFATGIAAQRLAESPNVDAILKVANIDEAKAKEAAADAEKAEADNERIRLLQNKIDKSVSEASSKILACTGSGDNYEDGKKSIIFAEAKLKNPGKFDRKERVIKAIDNSDDLKNYLSGEEGLRAAMAEAAENVTICT